LTEKTLKLPQFPPLESYTTENFLDNLEIETLNQKLIQLLLSMRIISEKLDKYSRKKVEKEAQYKLKYRNYLLEVEGKTEGQKKLLAEIYCENEEIEIEDYVEKMKCEISAVQKNEEIERNENFEEKLDFSDVKGQFLAKRAMEIAAAGGHPFVGTKSQSGRRGGGHRQHLRHTVSATAVGNGLRHRVPFRHQIPLRTLRRIDGHRCGQNQRTGTAFARHDGAYRRDCRSDGLLAGVAWHQNAGSAYERPLPKRTRNRAPFGSPSCH